MNDDQNEESIEALQRKLIKLITAEKERERIPLQRPVTPPIQQPIFEGTGIMGKVVAGILMAIISFLSAEMYDFHNQLISIEQKMTLLVTPDFKIVPSSKHIEHTLAREVISGRLKALEKEIERLNIIIRKGANLGAELREQHREACLQHLELLRSESRSLKKELTVDFRKSDEHLEKMMFKKTVEIEKDLDKLRKNVVGLYLNGTGRNKTKSYW